MNGFLLHNTGDRRPSGHLQRRQGTGVAAAAELLSCTDEETRQSLLAEMNQVDAEMVDRLKQSVIDFQTRPIWIVTLDNCCSNGLIHRGGRRL